MVWLNFSIKNLWFPTELHCLDFLLYCIRYDICVIFEATSLTVQVQYVYYTLRRFDSKTVAVHSSNIILDSDSTLLGIVPLQYDMSVTNRK